VTPLLNTTIADMKLIDFESYKENPSKPIGINRKHIKGVASAPIEMANPDTGELSLCTQVPKGRFVDNDTLQFKKVFNESLDTIKDFSTSAIKVWCYILNELPIRRDVVTVVIEDCKKFTGYASDVPIYRGIVELLEKEFIYRKVGSTTEYFINVNKYYNGDRTK